MSSSLSSSFPSSYHSCTRIGVTGVFRTLVVSFLLLLLNLDSASGYASWLKCYVELDPSEIVMHQYLVPPEQVKDPVNIEVQAYGTTTWSSELDQIYLVELPVSTDKVDNDDDDDDKSTLIKVRLAVPKTLERQDVQFVVEAITTSNDHESDENTNKKIVAQFVDRGVMCDGTRSFSRRHDEHVVLKIPPPPPPSSGGETNEETTVELVAAWAPGYEAVSLTHKMILRVRHPTEQQQPPPPPPSAASEEKRQDEL